jgi:hypothetical protein
MFCSCESEGSKHRGEMNTYVGSLLLSSTHVRLVDCSRPAVAAGSEERGGVIGRVAAGVVMENLRNIVVREEWKRQLKPGQ